MEISDLASVAGKSGLFKILKPTRTGVILETLDPQKKKLIANANHRVSSLSEISIYTTTAEGAVPLENILKRIYQEFQDDPGVDSTSSPEELKSFMQFIEPDFDKDKVYVSDIKRLVSWYKIIFKEAVEILENESEVEEESVKDEPSSES